jgi:hypothetical protein
MYVSNSLLEAYEQQIAALRAALELERNIPFSPDEADLSENLGRSNIVGVGLGEKIIGGVSQQRLAVRLYVVKKALPELVDPEYLAERVLANVLDPTFFVPDVLEVGRPALLHHVNKPHRPRLPGGIGITDEIGHSVGTLGGWLTDGQEYYLLTCYHSVAWNADFSTTVQVLHPPRRGEAIATIVAVIDPRDCQSASITMDVALARVNDRARAGDFILQLGQVAGLRKVRRLNGTNVAGRKMGALTHVTTCGLWDLTAELHLTTPDKSSLYYKGQLGVLPDPGQRAFANQGDSGALVLTMTNEVLGLLVGGNPSSPLYAVTPITPILDELKRIAGLRNLSFVEY